MSFTLLFDLILMLMMLVGTGAQAYWIANDIIKVPDSAIPKLINLVITVVVIAIMVRYNLIHSAVVASICFVFMQTLERSTYIRKMVLRLSAGF